MILINLYWEESNKISLNYILTSKLKIKYKLKVIDKYFVKIKKKTFALNWIDYRVLYEKM